MKMAVFSTKPYDREFLHVANRALPAPHQLVFLEPRLSLETAVLADGADAVCLFVNDVNDVTDAPVLEALAALGVRLIALRSAGFNNVDLVAAGRDEEIDVGGVDPGGVRVRADGCGDGFHVERGRRRSSMGVGLSQEIFERWNSGLAE